MLDQSFNMDIAQTFVGMNIYSRPKCQKCWAKFYCSGGCSAANYNMNHDMNDSYDLGCEMERKRLECAIYLKAMDKICANPVEVMNCKRIRKIRCGNGLFVRIIALVFVLPCEGDDIMPQNVLVSVLGEGEYLPEADPRPSWRRRSYRSAICSCPRRMRRPARLQRATTRFVSAEDELAAMIKSEIIAAHRFQA